LFINGKWNEFHKKNDEFNNVVLSVIYVIYFTVPRKRNKVSRT
jgi:hypothetical protein